MCANSACYTALFWHFWHFVFCGSFWRQRPILCTLAAREVHKRNWPGMFFFPNLPEKIRIEWLMNANAWRALSWLCPALPKMLRLQSCHNLRCPCSILHLYPVAGAVNLPISLSSQKCVPFCYFHVEHLDVCDCYALLVPPANSERHNRHHQQKTMKATMRFHLGNFQKWQDQRTNTDGTVKYIEDKQRKIKFTVLATVKTWAVASIRDLNVGSACRPSNDASIQLFPCSGLGTTAECLTWTSAKTLPQNENGGCRGIPCLAEITVDLNNQKAKWPTIPLVKLQTIVRSCWDYSTSYIREKNLSNIFTPGP